MQHAARALHEAGLLGAYVTSFRYSANDPLARISRLLLRCFYSDPERQLARRRVTEVPDNLVVSHPLPEMVRMFPVKAGLSPSLCDLIWEPAEIWFDHMVARKHLQGMDAVYGYEHAALATFTAQKKRGGLCIYEQPIAHHKTTSSLLDEEFARHPAAETSHDTHLRKHRPRRGLRKDQELALADLVIVNSTFTRNSLLNAGVPAARIQVVPLGSPSPVSETGTRPKSPFIFLSAGTQSVRKGVHYLLEAWRRLAPGGDAELWMIGKMLLAPRLLENLPGRVVMRHSVPREELFDIYQRSSVLVFPSLCEGFGMVITEAMAHGVPVITTCNTAGPDLIRSGENGFIVPIRDSESLAQVMQWCLDHRQDVCSMGHNAIATVAGWQWKHYRAALADAVGTFLSRTASERRSQCVV